MEGSFGQAGQGGRVESVVVRGTAVEVVLHAGIGGRWECDVESVHTWGQVIALAMLADLDEAVVHAELVAAVRDAGWCA